MGTDVVVAYVRETEAFSRAALHTLLGELWQSRGAKLEPAVFSPAAAEQPWDENDDLLGYALSPTSSLGWIALVESARVRMDKELLTLLGARTTCWLRWSCDHAGLYGNRRISKICNDVDVKARVLGQSLGLRASVAEASARFAVAASTERSPHDGRADMRAASDRFRLWVDDLSP